MGAAGPGEPVALEGPPAHRILVDAGTEELEDSHLAEDYDA
jgi:hypothetical protein